MIGIYKITNPKGKIYIGQSTDILYRKNRYKKHYCKNQTKLYNSILKYGWDNHIFEVICECLEPQLNEREIYYSQSYNSNSQEVGLNIRECGGNRGRLSEETKKKISESNIGKTVSQEVRQRIREKLMGNVPWNKGKKLDSPSWNKGVSVSVELKLRLRNLYLGKLGKEAKSAKQIIQKDLSGAVLNNWSGAREVERELGYKCSCINRCCRGERISSYGYKWEYAT